MAKWIKAKFPGVRYREHESRKHGVKFDRYYSVRYKLNGKDKEEALGWASQGWTEQKAVERLAELKQNQRTGEGAQTLQEKRDNENQKREAEKAEQERIKVVSITFGKFFTETYLPQAKIDRPKSVRADGGIYERWIMPVIGELPFSEVSPFHLEKIKKILTDKGRAPRTIEYVFALIRQTFNAARLLGIYNGESPTSKVKIPKVDNARLRFLTPEEAERLLEALAARSQDVHDQALLSLHAGLRFSEIASLTWADVNLENGALTIRDAKTGTRISFLTDAAHEMLKNRKKGLPHHYVFPAKSTKTKDGHEIPEGEAKMPIISQTFFRTVKDLKLNDGIIDRRLRVCFHTLRHSFGTLMYECTQDLYAVQRSLGHKTGLMAQRYAKMTEGRLKEVTQALGKALKIDKDNVISFQGAVEQGKK